MKCYPCITIFYHALECGDKTFKCVYARYNQRYCYYSFYKQNCEQTCKICDAGTTTLQCVNFKDSDTYGCAERGMNGECTTKEYYTRFNMKKNCPRTCCNEGRLYS